MPSRGELFYGTIRRTTHYIYTDRIGDFEIQTYCTYLFGFAAVLSIALLLIGLRGIVREGPLRCPYMTLNGTFLSGLLAFILIAGGAAGEWSNWYTSHFDCGGQFVEQLRNFSCDMAVTRRDVPENAP